MSTTDQLVVGSANAQSTYTPWPEQWVWPNTYVYPTYTYTLPADDYANEVEVEQHEHDATLRFYRRTGKAKAARTLVKELTVPLGVLQWLQGQAGDLTVD